MVRVSWSPGGRQRSIIRFIAFITTSNLILALIFESMVIGVSASSKSANLESYEDSEFAEFEEFDDDEGTRGTVGGPGGQVKNKVYRESVPPVDSSEDDGPDVLVENEDDEMDVFEESEEFEVNEPSRGDEGRKRSAKKPDQIEITNVPIHLRNSWESYYLEGLMIVGLLVYFINFIAGRDKNQRLAETWFEEHRELLENNFALVGDDGKKETETLGLMKETENVFNLWCSGRTCIEGMLIELKFIKRQDLINTISRLFTPSYDEILIKVYLNQDAMDSFVFCLANKKIAPKLAKEMNDFATFCPKIKTIEKYGVTDPNYVMMNEIGEVAGAILDPKIVSLLNKYPDAIQYIHISDQYSGFAMSEDTPLVKFPERRRIMMLGFKYPGSGNLRVEDVQSLKPLMQMVFYLIEKIRRFRLSREGKNKANKNRQKLEEIFLKATHSQRQEAAQAKREERKRAEKEKILNDEDPEKQRKWEEREYRREMKKKTSRMKQIKIKAM